MRSIREVEKAVQELSGQELAEFRRWFHDFDAKVWDSTLEADATAGRLDKEMDEALADLRDGRTRPL